MVKLRLFSALREIAGSKEVEVEGNDLAIRDALEKFVGKYGEKAQHILFKKDGDLAPSVLLLVNGETAVDGGNTQVSSGDTIQVLLPTAGG